MRKIKSLWPSAIKDMIENENEERARSHMPSKCKNCDHVRFDVEDNILFDRLELVGKCMKDINHQYCQEEI